MGYTIEVNSKRDFNKYNHWEPIKGRSSILRPRNTSEGYSVRLCLLIQPRDAVLHILEADVGVHVSGSCR